MWIFTAGQMKVKYENFITLGIYIIRVFFSSERVLSSQLRSSVSSPDEADAIICANCGKCGRCVIIFELLLYASEEARTNCSDYFCTVTGGNLV